MVGCATAPRYQVSVNSLRSPDAILLKTFIVASGNKDVGENDLQFIEARGLLESALLAKGFVYAESPAKADLVVFLSYGIGEPKTYTTTYTMPVYGQTGGGTSQVNTTVYGTRGPQIVTSTVSQPVTYGVTGHQTKTSSRTLFGRWLRVDAISAADYKKTGRFRSVWETKVVSAGSSGDLRLIIPVMIRGAQNYLGEDTGRYIDLTL